MGRRIGALAAMAVLAIGWGHSGTARANEDDVSVAVLGIRSLEGDDEFARNLTGAIRFAASQVPSWDVANREVSLAQMTLAHGCDEPDAACMSKVASALDTERIIYGTTRRTSAGADYDFSLGLYFFNAETGQIEGSIADTIPRVQTDIDNLRPRAERYIRQFAGQVGTGKLRVQVNVPGAVVRIDGERAGVAGPSGELVAPVVTAGRHEVEVSADRHTGFRGSVVVVADEESSVEVHLEPRGPDTEPTITTPTFVTLGLAAAFGVATIGTGVRIVTLNNDSDLLEYRRMQDPGVDACADAAVRASSSELAAAADDVCSKADVLEPMWIAFLSATIASAAVGTYFLTRDLMDDDDPDEPEGVELSVMPSFNRRGGRVDATLRF